MIALNVGTVSDPIVIKLPPTSILFLNVTACQVVLVEGSVIQIDGRAEFERVERQYDCCASLETDPPIGTIMRKVD